ncbi:MAG: hypothetical protein WA432_04525 [Candidatus Babeliaceae bacterium]
MSGSKIKLLSCLFFLSVTNLVCRPPMYFALATDTEFYERAVNLIATIHYYNFECTEEIAVFDLGLDASQRNFLNDIEKVKVYDVELVHPQLLTKFVVAPDAGKYARGWYAWKPVIIKQALDMFPYVLYMDAGISVVGPLDDLFEHLQQVGYLFVDCNYLIKARITRPVINLFNLFTPQKNYIVNRLGISAGFQGVTHHLYEPYVMPMYNIVKNNFECFIDDGSAPGGFGEARHDQMIASVMVNLLNYTIHRIFFDHGPALRVAAGLKEFKRDQYIHFTKEQINLNKTKPYLHMKPPFARVNAQNYYSIPLGSVINKSQKLLSKQKKTIKNKIFKLKK